MDVGAKMGDLTVCCLLYADDAVLLADSEEDLQALVTKVYDVCKESDLLMNVEKSNVMVFERNESMTECKIVVNGESLKQVEEFVYLGSMFTRDGNMEKDIERRVSAGNRVNGALKSVVANKCLSNEAKLAVHNGVLVPTLMYGSEAWSWKNKDESRLNAVEMRSLRRMCGKTMYDRCTNAEIRAECKAEVSIIDKIKKGLLRWFGHVERMNGERTTKRIYDASMPGYRSRGRPRKTWHDQVKQILESGHVKSRNNRRACMRRCMNVEEAKIVCQDRVVWRSILSAYPLGEMA
jgi:hypothetical protein